VSVTQPPLPPPELIGYVGHHDRTRQVEEFERFGRRYRAAILDLLPPDWSFEGKRVLDFGCGSGRVLRHFLDEAGVAELHGSDIDPASIAWLEQNLSPPMHFNRNAEEPGLPYPDDHFDLVWATSVFSVLTDTWSGWMSELHRVLRRDGLLIVTFVGEGGSEFVAREPWVEDRVGMNVLAYGVSWDVGGPMVMHSPWWIHEHWGRAFDILELLPRTEWGEGLVAMRKRDVRVTPEELERIDPRDEREIRALRHNLSQVQREGVLVREAGTAERRALEQSWSWRLTRPLRAVGRLLRRVAERRRVADTAQ
jgi:SAM-dependent methyltransferase